MQIFKYIFKFSKIFSLVQLCFDVPKKNIDNLKLNIKYNNKEFLKMLNQIKNIVNIEINQKIKERYKQN